MDNYQTNVLDLLADLIHEQQKTRAAITDFAEALAGVKREAAPEPVPSAEEKPAEPAPAEPAPAPALDRSNSAPEDRTAYLAKLRKTFAAKSKEGKKSELKALLESFGAVKLPDVNEENWPELLEKAEAI